MLTLLITLNILMVIIQLASLVTLSVIAFYVKKQYDSPTMNLPILTGLSNSLRYPPPTTDPRIPAPPVKGGSELSGGNYV